MHSELSCKLSYDPNGSKKDEDEYVSVIQQQYLFKEYNVLSRFHKTTNTITDKLILINSLLSHVQNWKNNVK